MRKLKKAVCKLVLVLAAVSVVVLIDAAAHGYIWQTAVCGTVAVLAANGVAGGLLPEGQSHDAG